MKLTSNRMHSLDIFRGITVFLMLIVNNPGSDHNFEQLDHAAWHGCTLTDLVFPFFLFIVGVSAVLSISKKLNQGLSKATIFKESAWRAFYLLAVGWVLFLFPFYVTWRWQMFRIPGVLQRIGLVYFAVAWLILYASKKQRAVVSASLLILYYVVMVWIPLPHHEGGVPNLLNDPHATWSAYIDRLLMWGHLWKFSIHWDPEGLLSTVPSIVTGLLGVFAGEWIQQTGADRFKQIKGLVGIGICLIGLGFLFRPLMPFNKALWTSPYVLLSGGWAMLFLSTCIWFCDVLKIQKPFQIFYWFGVNPILAFVGSAMMARTIGALVMIKEPKGDEISLQAKIFHSAFESWISQPKIASLSFALSFTLVWACLLAWAHHKRIYLKV